MAQIPITDKDREISTRLKEVRTQFRLSQAEWGKRLGVSRDKVADIERNKARAPAEMQSRAVELFGLSPVWLLEGSGEMVVDSSAALAQRLDLVGKTVEAATEVARAVGGDEGVQRVVQEAAYTLGTKHLAADPSEPPYGLSTERLAVALERVDRYRPARGALSASQRARLIAALYELPGNPASASDAAIRAVLAVGEHR